jgi:catechol 2,3-dioxygenase-like lactoylglutathione lyase family enzyme
MTTSLDSLGAITLFVQDPERSKAFYRAFLQREPVFEDGHSVVFRLENTVLNLLGRAHAAELVEPAAVAPQGIGSQLQLTIWVDDTDSACATLEERGLTRLNGPIDRAWGQRTATFADPDGHVWEVAASLR